MKESMKETKDFLNQVAKIDAMVQNKREEIEEVRNLAESMVINTGERVQSSGSKQRMADTVERYLDMERKLNEDIERLINAKRDVLEVIEQLPVDQYKLLYQVYIKGVELKCYDTDKSYAWVKSTHGRALVNVRDILRSRKCN